MTVRLIVCSTLAAASLALATSAFADDASPSRKPPADATTVQQSYTVAPLLPIPFGALGIAKLSNGARLVRAGAYLDLHDARGATVARFDHRGRTLEPPAQPVDVRVTSTAVLFLGSKNETLMSLPRR